MWARHWRRSVLALVLTSFGVGATVLAVTAASDEPEDRSVAVETGRHQRPGGDETTTSLPSTTSTVPAPSSTVTVAGTVVTTATTQVRREVVTTPPPTLPPPPPPPPTTTIPPVVCPVLILTSAEHGTTVALAVGTTFIVEVPNPANPDGVWLIGINDPGDLVMELAPEDVTLPPECTQPDGSTRLFLQAVGPGASSLSVDLLVPDGDPNDPSTNWIVEASIAYTIDAS